MDRVSQAVKELVEEIQRMPEAPDRQRRTGMHLPAAQRDCRMPQGAGDTVPHGVPDFRCGDECA